MQLTSQNLTVDIFTEREEWKKPLIFSAVLHVAVFGTSLLWGNIFGRGPTEDWGGVGGGAGVINAQLVSQATIPLPRQEAPQENVVVTESKGLSQSEPRQKEPVVEQAIPIPERDAKRTADQRRSVTETPKPKPPQDNVVPFGEGGPARVPAATFNTQMGTGGMTFSGGGDFGARYAWYVNQVKTKISQNWFTYQLDPSVRTSRRVYVAFDINRDGSIDSRSIQLQQSSGIPALDRSAMQALQRIDTFGPLPNDYRGSKVAVEFWFEYTR